MSRSLLAVLFVLVLAVTFRWRVPWGWDISGSASRPAASSDERKPTVLTAEELQRQQIKPQVIAAIVLIVVIVCVNMLFLSHCALSALLLGFAMDSTFSSSTSEW